jgi:hypothetical protein
MLVIAKEVVAGSPQGWMFLVYPLFFGAMLLNYGSAFSFLYWSALQGRGESSPVELPAASRDDSRERSSGMRPSTLVWGGLPVLMLLITVWRVSSSGDTVAMDAALNEGRAGAVLKLLNAGIPVDRRDPGGETPLFDAAVRGQFGLATALLDRGANPNARNKARATPLVVAVGHGQLDLARLLLDRGASVNASNQEGRTSLMLAAMGGRTALVQLLLDHGADRTLTDSHQKTALAYAHEEAHDDVVRLLTADRR